MRVRACVVGVHSVPVAVAAAAPCALAAPARRGGRCGGCAAVLPLPLALVLLWLRLFCCGLGARLELLDVQVDARKLLHHVVRAGLQTTAFHVDWD